MKSNEKASESKHSLFSGVLFLTVSGIVVKIIGLMFKIPLSSMIGDEGMGYFNSAYTIYAWLYMICTAGVPVAVSMMVSESMARGDLAETDEIRKRSLRLFFLIGTLFTVAMLLLSNKIAHFIGSDNAGYAIVAIAPSLLFVCISAVIRGYNQGQGSMMPTALSQLFEAAGKLVLGLLFTIISLRRGAALPIVAAYAIFGVTVGSAFSMLYLLLFDHLKRKKIKIIHLRGDTHILRRLLFIILPITISSSVMSLTGIADLALIMKRLTHIGYTASEATAMYGNYSTLVVPMLNLPTVFIYPIAYAMIPALTYSRTRQDRNEIIRLADNALRVVSTFAIPVSVFMGVFSFPILSVVFNDTSSHFAASYLTIISPAVFFLCIVSITNSILQAMGKQSYPIWSMLCGAAVKLITGYILIGDQSFALRGAPIGTVLCYLTVSVLNIVFILRELRYVPNISKFIVMPVLFSILTASVSTLLYKKLSILVGSKLLLLVFSVAPAVIMYLFFVLCFDIVDLSEIKYLNKIDNWFRRLRSNIRHKMIKNIK